jgi:hypothetical protein
MAYVDKLVDTQNTVMHDFNGEDQDDNGNRSRKRSSEGYVADPPRPSTLLEGDLTWSWTTNVSSNATPNIP